MPAKTKAAEARRSLAMTSAPLSGWPPLMMALGPSIEMSAPIRANSFTCMKRDSKIRSVMMLIPGDLSISTIICACTSVGKPACGMVVMSTERNFLAGRTRRVLRPVSIRTPASRILSSTALRWLGWQLRSVTSPSVTAPARA